MNVKMSPILFRSVRSAISVAPPSERDRVTQRYAKGLLLLQKGKYLVHAIIKARAQASSSKPAQAGQCFPNGLNNIGPQPLPSPGDVIGCEI